MSNSKNNYIINNFIFYYNFFIEKFLKKSYHHVFSQKHSKAVQSRIIISRNSFNQMKVQRRTTSITSTSTTHHNKTFFHCFPHPFSLSPFHHLLSLIFIFQVASPVKHKLQMLGVYIRCCSIFLVVW